MKTLRETALAFCAEDPLFYIDIAECVKGGGKILYASENGVFVEHTESGILMLAAKTESAAERALASLAPDSFEKRSRWLVAREGAARETVYKSLPVSRETTCFQVAYLGKESFEAAGELSFKRAERAQIEQVKQNYALESPENLERLFSAGKIFCGFDEKGNFVGFIGSHPEGSMGMLYIFPEYRRKGYAEELEKRLANEYLKNGRVPYGHVIEDNLASLALQKKLGLKEADGKICWLRIGKD
ncbi:MAG: GNAT family N-acetyltransferase [Clostridia bacterium]|nr:GNAT family N-acetyltransferase [Clostridia bacterium]